MTLKKLMDGENPKLIDAKAELLRENEILKTTLAELELKRFVEDSNRKQTAIIRACLPEEWIIRDTAYNQRLWQSWCEGLYEYLGSRPTIIPAETPEEET